MGTGAMGGKTYSARQGFAQEHSNGTGDTADLDDSNVVVGGGQGGREEVGGGVGRSGNSGGGGAGGNGEEVGGGGGDGRAGLEVETLQAGLGQD